MTRNSQDSRSNLTRWVSLTRTQPESGLKERTSFKSCLHRVMVLVLLVWSFSGLAITMSTEAAAPYVEMSAKQYAKAQLTKDHYKCISKLYGKESAWNPDASNGSHNGIPQGRSKWLATATPLQQIDWGLAYIAHRYGKVDGQPDTCAALDHWKKYNWH